MTLKQIKWQCKECGTCKILPEKSRPQPGGFCGKSKDHKHKWVKVK